jgi:hypothetical protein
MDHRVLKNLTALPILLVVSGAYAQTAGEGTAKPSATPKTESAPAPVAEPKKDAPPSTSRWQMTYYGFLEVDAMRDSTQSFGDSVANSPVLRSDGSLPAVLPIGLTAKHDPLYGAKHPRVQFSARNSRFGFRMAAPEYAGMKVSGTLELDFMGNQPSNPPATSESAFYTNATPRLRHAYAKVESDVVDVILGQYYHLFGWQPLYFPATVSYLGIPNEIFGRTPQIRLSKTIKTDPVNFEVAVAALRPVQRDSGMPDVQGGVRFGVNGWKGAHGAGSGQATLDALSIGVTGAYRKFRVVEFINNVGDPSFATDAAEAAGYGISIDGIIPVIPASSIDDKGNALTLTGSYVTGAGIGDLFTGGLTGGTRFPLPEGPAGQNTGTYASNIEPGVVQYSVVSKPGEPERGFLRVLNWTAFMVGFQYFLPPSGKVILTGNYSRGKSNNIGQSDTEGGDPHRTFRQSDYFDVNVFADLTPSLRLGLSFQRVQQTFTDSFATPPPATDPAVPTANLVDGKDKNDRFEFAGYFFF